MSKHVSLKKICGICLAVYCVVAVLLYLIAGDAFHIKRSETVRVDPSAVVGEIIGDNAVNQPFSVAGDRLTAYRIRFATYGRENNCLVTLSLSNTSGEVLHSKVVSAADLADNADYTVTLEQPIAGQDLILSISSDAADPENAVTVYYGNGVTVGRGSVTQSYTDDRCVYIGTTALDGELYLALSCDSDLWFGDYYWVIAIAGLVALVLYSWVLVNKQRSGKKSGTLNFIASIEKYRFLIKQLVSRDFKTKYRRSVLGVFWSFLNPLLTMMVQYIVFSTLFRSSIENYPVYLLSGIVLFNFFNETTTVGLTSITSNAPLITKVYVPKYIYPLTRMLSSGINVALSLIPLFIVTVATGVFPAASWLLLVYALLCLMAFALGVTYLLSTMMVYFRDTQFLWSVVSMIWMYCTPIFYPETIIPAKLLPLYHLNPLYQIIQFARCALIDRVSPEPMSYLICLLVGLIPLLVGIWVFRRKEKDFVLYL